MKFNKTAALFTSVIIAAMPFSTSLAAGETEKQTPVYKDNFNQNDVNGTVEISLPENVTAHVKITFDSPEGKNLPYYDSKIDSTGSFDIEGRDKTEDDFRTYNLTISLIGGEYGRTAEVTDTFAVLDPNDHPNTFTTFEYKFTVDNAYSAETTELTKEEHLGGIAGGYIHSKEYAFHLGLLMGDVDGDGKITGSDATQTLVEYTRISSDLEGSFSKYQNTVADVNKDGILNGTDATMILRYYTILSSGGTPSWND
ncbi:MAG: hypothetical protein IKK47_01745 [Ruminococcus sp.]|nr:hypothetical protein [Ruminococcus sp.]